MNGPIRNAALPCISLALRKARLSASALSGKVFPAAPSTLSSEDRRSRLGADLVPVPQPDRHPTRMIRSQITRIGMAVLLLGGSLTAQVAPPSPPPTAPTDGPPGFIPSPPGTPPGEVPGDTQPQPALPPVPPVPAIILLPVFGAPGSVQFVLQARGFSGTAQIERGWAAVRLTDAAVSQFLERLRTRLGPTQLVRLTGSSEDYHSVRTFPSQPYGKRVSDDALREAILADTAVLEVACVARRRGEFRAIVGGLWLEQAPGVTDEQVAVAIRQISGYGTPVRVSATTTYLPLAGRDASILVKDAQRLVRSPLFRRVHPAQVTLAR